ncbi:MAG: hypothetical protein GEU78_08160 [Actinobacteria bacterium]|nr:hypothetical protein [Actinomycetota bacterium]
MADFLEEFAAALDGRLGTGPDAALSRELKNPLLDLARVVAHSTERKNAPLATFIAGRYVELRRAQGADDMTAIGEVAEAAEKLLPAEGD